MLMIVFIFIVFLAQNCNIHGICIKLFQKIFVAHADVKALQSIYELVC